jgi:hypothetical protein
LPSWGFTLNQSVLGKNHGKFTVNQSESNRITPDKREGGAGFTDCGRSAEPVLGVTLIPQAPRRLPPAFPNRAQSRQVVVNRGLKKTFPFGSSPKSPLPHWTFARFDVAWQRLEIQNQQLEILPMKEIRTQDWNTFCRRLNEFERGANVDILWIDRATNAERSVARAVEFENISFGQRDGCSDQIVIRAGGEGGRETRHEITEPIHILLRESGQNGTYNAVAVEAEEGTTILTFHPVIHPGWLEGLELQGGRKARVD